MHIMPCKKTAKLAVLLVTIILFIATLTACRSGSYERRYDTGYPHADDTPLEYGDTIPPTAYVGAAHETQRIVNALPLPAGNMEVDSIQIGADHGGFGCGAYTLTIHYNFYGDNFNASTSDVFADLAATLFGHIGNLRAVTFSINDNDDLSTGNYIFRWSITRTGSDAGEDAVISSVLYLRR